DDVEHQSQLIIEAVRNADRRVRQLDVRQIPRLELLHAALDLADALEVVADDDPVLCAEPLLERRRLRADGIEQARVLGGEQCALLGGVALAEQALEELARVELHRQWRRRRAKRYRRAVAAAVVAVAGAAADRLLGRDLERWERRLLADVLRGDLIGRDAAERVV